MKNLPLKAVLLATTFALTVPFAGVAFAQGTTAADTTTPATQQTPADTETVGFTADITAGLPSGVTIENATPE